MASTMFALWLALGLIARSLAQTDGPCFTEERVKELAGFADALTECVFLRLDSHLATKKKKKKKEKERKRKENCFFFRLGDKFVARV